MSHQFSFHPPTGCAGSQQRRKRTVVEKMHNLLCLRVLKYAVNSTNVNLKGVLGTGNGRAPRAALRKMYQEQREACPECRTDGHCRFLYTVFSVCHGRLRGATATMATLENDGSRQAFSRLQGFQILRQTATRRTIVASEDGSPSRWTMFVPASLCSAAVSAFCRLQRRRFAQLYGSGTLRSHGLVQPSGRLASEEI